MDIEKDRKGESAKWMQLETFTPSSFAFSNIRVRADKTHTRLMVPTGCV